VDSAARLQRRCARAGVAGAACLPRWLWECLGGMQDACERRSLTRARVVCVCIYFERCISSRCLWEQRVSMDAQHDMVVCKRYLWHHKARYLLQCWPRPPQGWRRWERQQLCGRFSSPHTLLSWLVPHRAAPYKVAPVTNTRRCLETSRGRTTALVKRHTQRRTSRAPKMQ
jgi:hypothetical protein